MADVLDQSHALGRTAMDLNLISSGRGFLKCALNSFVEWSSVVQPKATSWILSLTRDQTPASSVHRRSSPVSPT
jgi:hypothetical protein